jgi:transcriptional antiterminator RfaH
MFSETEEVQFKKVDNFLTLPAKKWFVIYTKSRHEKKVANMLAERGIEAYCPLKIETNQWSDRKKRVDTPLFNSYLFVNILEKDLRNVFSVTGVVRYIYWCGKPAVVKDYEIDELKNWLAKYDHKNIEVQYYKPNDNVVIKTGAFESKQATVISQNGQNLVLQLSGLGLRLTLKLSQIIIDKAVG